MNKEIITFLIANYNNSQYLDECIQSIENQNSDRWLILICDDASTDDPECIYQKHRKNTKIKIIENEKNLGYIATLIRLIDSATTDKIAILDPDDAITETCVKDVMEYYDLNKSAGFVYTNFWYCDKNLTKKKLGYCKEIPKNSTVLENDWVSHLKTMSKKVYYLTEKYDTNILYAEDKDLILKMEEKTNLFFIDKPLYLTRVLEESQSHGENRDIGIKNYELAKSNATNRRKKLPFNNILRRNQIKYSLRKFGRELDYSLNPIWRYKRNKKAKKFKIEKEQKKLSNNIENALDNLKSAQLIFKNMGIKSWITDGTLLGKYREGNFIGHDTDIDIGCFISDYSKDILPNFIKNGWELVNVFGTEMCGLEITIKRNSIKLDIFFFYSELNSVYHAAWLNIFDEKGIITKRNMIKYNYDKFELVESDFLGIKINMPKDTLKYITTKYGENWQTPQENWDWAFDPKNAERTYTFIGVEND